METNDTNRWGREERYYYPVCGCWPGGDSRFGVSLLGGILVLAGGVWMLYNLNLISDLFLDVFWPLVMIGIGLSYLGWAYWNKQK